jgi:signal transduction histidine kinase
MSLALESQYLRSRELTTLYRLQQVRQLSNLHSDLAEALAHTVEALDADGGVLFLADAETAELRVRTETGQPLGSTLALVQGLANGAQQTESPLMIGDLKQAESEGENLRSLLIAPLHNEGRLLGSLVLWASRPDAFTRRQARLVMTVAGQAALLVENHRLYLQAEHQVALAERARLAREIHDGLAQTLGYLKLRLAQVVNWLTSEETRRARTGLDEVRDLLAEAYVDAREAIDGLRLKPGSGKLHEWLEQSLLDFQSLAAVQVEAPPPPELTLPAEVQTQLLRIVQETLSNIRKHAEATYVRLDWQVDEYWLTLRIADDGRGFDPSDVAPVSRHGLQIMRERAELLDADFQIVSRPDEGTRVIIRLPISQTHPERNDDRNN